VEAERYTQPGEAHDEEPPMQAGGFRIDLTKVPGSIAGMFTVANASLRAGWTLGERLREILRLRSAFEHECHT